MAIALHLFDRSDGANCINGICKKALSRFQIAQVGLDSIQNALARAIAKLLPSWQAVLFLQNMGQAGLIILQVNIDGGMMRLQVSEATAIF